MSPAITAVIINYNQGIYFEDCFASIKEQTFKDFELIVIDDRSTDDSVEQIKAVLSRYNFPHRLVVNEKNQGICANLNMALQMADGKYFTFIASDDWGEKSRFEKMHAALTAAGNENKVAYSDCKLVDPEKKLLHESYLKHFRPGLSSPPQAEASFSCPWLVGMSAKDGGAVRVGCGLYHWSFRPRSPRLAIRLEIVIELMQLLPADTMPAVTSWLFALPYPWCAVQAAFANAPRLDELDPLRQWSLENA